MSTKVLQVGNYDTGGIFTLPIEAVTQTFCILAKRGVGKTATAVVMAEEMIKAGMQVVIIDPLDCWYGLRSSADGKHEGVPIVVIGGERGDLPLNGSDGRIIADFIVDHQASVVLSLRHLSNQEGRNFVGAFLDALYDRKGESKNRTPLHLIIDEADAYCPQRLFPGTEKCFGAVDRIVRRGRSSGMGVTLISQRSAAINKDCLTQAEVMVALRTISPQDRKAIEAWIEAHDANDQHKEFMSSLASLPIGTAWFWSPGWLEIFKKVQVRRRHTFDSSATPKIGEKVITPVKVAAVDIEGLRAKLQATIEQKKADDPKELKKRIIQLEIELKKKIVAPKPIPLTMDAPEMKKAYAMGYDTALTDMKGALRDIEKKNDGTVPSHVILPRSPAQKAVIDQREGWASIPPRKISEPRQKIGPFSEERLRLPIGERAVLTACIQLPNGLRREQLTVLTGYKRSSRDAYIARLGGKGLIEARGDKIFPTDAGREALPDADPLPTGKALQDYHMDRLPIGEKAILQELIQAYPEAVHRDTLSEKTGYLRSSRDAYISRLAAKELVSMLNGGVMASENLF